MLALGLAWPDPTCASLQHHVDHLYFEVRWLRGGKDEGLHGDIDRLWICESCHCHDLYRDVERMIREEKGCEDGRRVHVRL